MIKNSQNNFEKKKKLDVSDDQISSFQIKLIHELRQSGSEARGDVWIKGAASVQKLTQTCKYH